MEKRDVILSCMEKRRSCRNFKSDMIPSDILEKILRAGTFAASGRNRQSPVIIAVTNKKLRDEISLWNRKIMGTDSDPFYNAPVILIVLADKNVPTYLYDVSLVMANLMLAAHSCGVASCWIHRAKEEFDSDEGKLLLKKLGISGEYEGIGHCALGYSAVPLPEEAPPRKKDYIYYVD